MAESRPLVLTCGDPAGVGPEIIVRWLDQHPAERGAVTVVGPARWLATLPDDVRRVALGPDDYAATPGEPNATGARLAWQAMQHAATGCVRGDYAAVVTGPVSKAALAAVGYPYPGQTEFFAAEWGGEPVMAFRGDRLRLALATWHVPLREVPALITASCLARTVRAAARLAAADGVESPRIAVCGLNPHAGEGGLLGGEERDLIDPALDVLRVDLPGLSRTLPGDTAFGRAIRGEFDVVVALYHDQGLAPLKAVDFDNAVNVTLGLPHVRTSPDHGTAFGIAGRGVADATSFTRAVEMARRLVGAQ